LGACVEEFILNLHGDQRLILHQKYTLALQGTIRWCCCCHILSLHGFSRLPVRRRTFADDILYQLCKHLAANQLAGDVRPEMLQ
jgi:hypothetical protein